MTNTLIMLHVVSGTGAVLGLIGALGAKKGGLWHRRSGRLYTISMALAMALALIVSAITLNIFLFLIGLFTAYFIYTGWRVAVVKDGSRSALDQRLCQLMLLCAIGMIGYGVYLVRYGESLGVALAVFGIFAFLPASVDQRRGTVWPKGKERIALHLNRMGGGGIATLTAVFVVNIQTSPAFIAWLLPSLVGTPLIIYWTKRALS